MALKDAGLAGVGGHYYACLVRAALLVVALVAGVWPLAAAGLQLGTTKSFNPATINSGQATTLTIGLVNGDPSNDASQIGYSDNFPAGMTLAPGAQTNSCGGSLVATAGSISLVNGILIANGGTCVVSVAVTATASVSTTLTNIT